MLVYEYLVKLYGEHGHELRVFGVTGSSISDAMADARIVLHGSQAVRAEVTRGAELKRPNNDIDPAFGAATEDGKMSSREGSRE